MKNLAFLLALSLVDGLGPLRLQKIIEHYQDPKLAWEDNPQNIKQLKIPQSSIDILKNLRIKLNPEKYLEQVLTSGIKVLSFFDSDYPQTLKNIYNPPIILFYKGQILEKDQFSISIVGTRKITSYGTLVTEKLTSELVAQNLTIISGLARGVDTIAHQTAINQKGRTIAVLGGGLNYIFPSDNQRLASKIINGQGAIISEYHPDAPSLPRNFPQRNRIIAGLSLATLVTEADFNSGSLITAKLAAEQGKEVFAVPGPITSAVSNGAMSLIKDGAKLVSSTKDILEELGIEPKIKVVVDVSNLSVDEKQIIECLSLESKHIDEVCRQLKKEISLVSALLLKMEIQGLVKNLGQGTYISNL